MTIADREVTRNVDGMSTETQPAADVSTLVERFGAVVEAVPADAWGNPSPCEGWSAADVVAHVVDSHYDFFERAGIEAPPKPDVAADPVAAWQAHRTALEGILADPEVADMAYQSMFGETTVGAMLADFYGFDLIVHRSDLARATGVADHLSDEEIDRADAAADGFGDNLYHEGVCTEAVAVPADASREDRLLGRLGRDPGWQPAG